MENLTYYGQLEGLSRKRSFARAEEVMGLLGLTSEKTKRAHHLSGGQKKKAALRYGHHAQAQSYLYG